MSRPVRLKQVGRQALGADHAGGPEGPASLRRGRPSILLVELPFKTWSRPSIGLALLKASLERAGFACDVRYTNLDFAARVGLDVYRTIAEEVPEPLLLGDLIFAPAVDPSRGRFEDLRERGSLFLEDGSPIGSAPGWLWDRLPELQREAASFAERCAEQIAQSDASIVGFSCMFQTLPSLAVAKALRPRARDKWILFGGSHCEGEMGLALHEAYPFIDLVARGEAEELIIEVAQAVEGDRRSLTQIPGLVWREGGRSATCGESARRAQDLDALPRPTYDDWLSQLRRAAPSIEPTSLELPFETSRGCWYGEKHHCTFCGLNGDSMTYRRKSADRALDEIRELGRYGIRSLYAVDLILDHRYFDTLLPALARLDADHSLFFETKSNLTRRQVELLALARVRVIQPGIESLSTPVLTRMRKGVTALQNVRLLKWTAELGVAVVWALLYGFPREDGDDYRVMAELIPSISHLSPPLGSYKVRADRFSPLFVDGEARGSASLCASPAYALVHGVSPDLAERMAYHFDINCGERDLTYLAPLASAVRAWREALGRSSFTSLDENGALRLFDRRPIAAVPRATLEGIERAVYLACDAGALPAKIEADLGEPHARVMPILERFQELRWVARLDGRFVSLAVPVDAIVPPGLPDAALPSITHAFYVKRALSLALSLSRDAPPERGTTIVSG